MTGDGAGGDHYQSGLNNNNNVKHDNSGTPLLTGVNSLTTNNANNPSYKSATLNSPPKNQSSNNTNLNSMSGANTLNPKHLSNNTSDHNHEGMQVDPVIDGVDNKDTRGFSLGLNNNPDYVNSPFNSIKKGATPNSINTQINQSGHTRSDSVGMDESLDDSEELYSEDDESRPTGDLVLKVPNVGKFKDQDFIKEKKIFGNAVRIRCLPWKILLMLRLTSSPDRTSQKAVGFFVQCNGDSDSTTWNCHAKVELRIKAHKKGCEDVVRKIEHNFFSKENDWGFSAFISYNELMNPDKGLLLDETVHLHVHVIADAPHGVDWDSKKYTGFVGLKNQGATCYMNSLLQTLYFTNKLRKAVYLMPTESDDTARSVPLALQRVFYELQFSNKAVGTKKLTKSFGWETLDSFMQHDAQELCRVLMDNMEIKMKGTSVEDTIPSLFRGKMLSYIRCKHVCFESKHEENFYDIQLKVKGTGDLYTAFRDYVAVETLDNENKYDAGEHGLQEAEKGVIFLKFPPVLYLQLMRFQYDHVTDANIKINDRFEFPYHLDLDKFLREPAPVPASYFLHAVLVHSGDNHGGHYVVYINPQGNNKWYKFDDDVVSKCSRKEAIVMNYGGTDEEIGMRMCANAYMLVYIEESARDDVLSRVEETDIPETLRERFSMERKIELQKKQEKSEAHLYAAVNLILEEDFYGWQGYDLYNPDTVPLRRIRVPKNVNQAQFVNIVAEVMHQKAERIALWHVQMRNNQTNRISILDLKENSLRQDAAITVWVQAAPPESDAKRLPNFDINEDLLVFLKFYNPRTRTIHYCGNLSIRLRCSINSILPILCERANLPANTRLMLFEERKPLSIERIMNFEQPIDDCVQEVTDGNIIVFQPEINTSIEPMTTAADYFRDIYYRVDVLFVDKSQSNEDEGFVLTLSLKATYWVIASAVGKYLNVDPEMLQFFKAQSALNYKEPPGAAIRCNFENSLKDLLPPYPRPKTLRRLYYQRLEMKITDLENMRQFRCVVVNNRLKEVSELVINITKIGTVKDILDEARKHIELPPNGSGRLRLMEVVSSKITQIFSDDLKISQLQTSSSRTLRIEEIPLDEINLQENEMVIYVAHFHKDSFQTFGVPFTLKIKDGESFQSVRERIQQKLDVSEKEFEKWRFAVINSRANYFNEDEGHSPISISLFENSPGMVSGLNSTGNIPLGTALSRPWLGLEHKFPPKRARYTFTEKAIKIHN